MMMMMMMMMLLMIMMMMMMMKMKMMKMMMMMHRPSSLRVRAKPRHLPIIYIYIFVGGYQEFAPQHDALIPTITEKFTETAAPQRAPATEDPGFLPSLQSPMCMIVPGPNDPLCPNGGSKMSRDMMRHMWLC